MSPRASGPVVVNNRRADSSRPRGKTPCSSNRAREGREERPSAA